MTLARRIATPCAWLPADAVTMPRAICSSESDAILLYAPRIFERTGHLQVLRLEQNLMPGQLRQGARGNDLSVTRGAFQTLGGELQLGRVVTLQCLKDAFCSIPRIVCVVLPNGRGRLTCDCRSRGDPSEDWPENSCTYS